MRPVSDGEFAADVATIVVVSVLICTSAHDLALMTSAVPLVLALRLACWGWLRGWRGLWPELAFFAVCTLLGGFNDWNSVVRYRIYDYHVPHHFPELSTIPLWMLLYWGMILRFFVSIATWSGLDAGSQPRNQVRLGTVFAERPALKVGLQLALVLGTRQVIYRTFDDPVWSWAPFAVVGLVYLALFGLDRSEARLAGIVVVLGPLVEVLYIHVGELHSYSLGWLGGVPLWLALWWVLAVLIWKDLGRRLELWLIDLSVRAWRSPPHARASADRSAPAPDAPGAFHGRPSTR